MFSDTASEFRMHFSIIKTFSNFINKRMPEIAQDNPKDNGGTSLTDDKWVQIVQ